MDASSVDADADTDDNNNDDGIRLLPEQSDIQRCNYCSNLVGTVMAVRIRIGCYEDWINF